jgi:2-furoyl-CoA dehydrogenase large subunit
MERVEDDVLLSGTARFIADIDPPSRAGHASILRSPHAHARIERVDVTSALQTAGVRAIITAADIAGWVRPIPNILTRDARMAVLADGVVRYVGEPVAVVVAESRAIAEDAAELIDVTYEQLPPVVDPVHAAMPGAPVLHERVGTNVVHERSFHYGEPDPVFAAAADIVSIETHFPRSTATPLETFGLIADYDPGTATYTVHSNYGGPMALQTVMAGALGVPVGQLRLVMPEHIGGNFGIKQALYPYLVVMALASRAAGCPVRWIEDRNEHLAGSSAGSERLTGIDAALDGEGRILGLRVRQLENFGAHIRTPEPAGLYRMHGIITGPYDIADVDVANSGVVTNQVPSGLNRGFGGPQLVYALEGVLDDAARRLGIDRAEIRRRNFVRADQFPYECAAGAVLDSGEYAAVLDKALAAIGYEEATARAAAAREEGRLVGVGLGCSVETSGNNLGYMSLAVDPDDAARQLAKSGAGATVTLSMDALGGILLQLDSPSCGQGYQTVAAQVVADALGVSPDAIAVRTAIDTAIDGWVLTSGNYANRFSTAVVSACVMAARRAADQLRAQAGYVLGVSADQIELRADEAIHDETGRSVAIRRLAGQLHWNIADRADGVQGPIRETAVFAPTDLQAPDGDRMQTSFTYSFQCDVCVVEVDPTTGELLVEKYVSVHDAGTRLNPGMFEGQVRGGFAHGYGAAMHELLAYANDGSLLTADFRDYSPVRAADLPMLVTDHIETPSPATLTGAKGLGDGCAMLTPSVIASAIADALDIDRADVGAPPFTPARLWQLCRR